MHCCRTSAKQLLHWAPSISQRAGAISVSDLAAQKAELRTWTSGTIDGILLKPAAAAGGTHTVMMMMSIMAIWWVTCQSHLAAVLVLGAWCSCRLITYVVLHAEAF